MISIPHNRLPQKYLLQGCHRQSFLALFVVASLGLAGCGGGNDPVVAADGAQQMDPPANNGSAGGDPGGDGNGSGDGTDGDGSMSGAPANGDPLLADVSIVPTTATYNCKIESSAGNAVQETRTLGFERATLTFTANGTPVIEGGFTWNATTMEWTANTLAESAGIVQEYFAKVDPENIPTYYRSKTTQADFSFEQTECYLGLAVQGPFLDGIPQDLASEPIACRRVQTVIGTDEILSDSGVLQEQYLVSDGTFFASLISASLDTAAIVVQQPIPPNSIRTVLENGDVMYETTITSAFVRRSELVVDEIGRFKYAHSKAGSRTGDFQTFCGSGVENFLQ